MSHPVLIGLGSNLDRPCEQIKQAIASVVSHKDITLIKTSSVYESLPQGPQDQDNFLNAVILISTCLSPQALLQTLQEIERQQGKIKVRHWGERCIDLDILFYGKDVINTPDLIIPHPFALERDFVLLPALEVAPEWSLPDNSLLESYLDSCTNHDLKIVSEPLYST